MPRAVVTSGEQVGVPVIERVIVLAVILLSTSFAGFLFYLLAVWIAGRHRLHEPFTLQQLGIDALLLAGGLGFLAYALHFVMFGQDAYDIAFPAGVAQGLNVAPAVLSLSSVPFAICGVGFMVVDYFLHLPNRSS